MTALHAYRDDPQTCAAMAEPAPMLEADDYRDALKADPSFIGEAIGNADLTEVTAAYMEGDKQALMDAVSDCVDEWIASNARPVVGRSEEQGLAALCKLHGVTA